MSRYYKKFIKIIFLMVASISVFSSCHRTTLEDQAEKMAEDYTNRYCPTPVEGMQRTDSITFDKNTKTFSFYFTLTDKADDPIIISKSSKDISKTLLSQLKENTSYKVYKDAGYKFNYIFRSQKNKSILFKKMFTLKDYKN